jgi:hypothetical protein
VFISACAAYRAADRNPSATVVSDIPVIRNTDLLIATGTDTETTLTLTYRA